MALYAALASLSCFFFHLWFFSGEETFVLAELVSLDGFWLGFAWVLGSGMVVAGLGMGVAGFGIK